jgi:hypothetical protein
MFVGTTLEEQGAAGAADPMQIEIDSVVALVVVCWCGCWFVASLLGPGGNRPAAAGGRWENDYDHPKRRTYRRSPGIQVDRVEDIEWPTFVLGGTRKSRND